MSPACGSGIAGACGRDRPGVQDADTDVALEFADPSRRSGLLTVCMELASSAVAALIALLATVLGFRLQERSAARRDRYAQQAQQCAELRQVFVRFLSRLAAMRRLQNG